ncbi:MAG TPA: hypothetical protein VIS96_18780, partial [Terrimicrobiaceae bacterium]
RRHRLSGHLFGGRYKAVLIDEGEPQAKMLYGYLGTVLDYLHLNPVRARIVGGRSNKSLLDYRWSSLTGAYLAARGIARNGRTWKWRSLFLASRITRRDVAGSWNAWS